MIKVCPRLKLLSRDEETGVEGYGGWDRQKRAFSDDDLQQVLFTSYLERRLVRYLCQVKESIEELKRSGCRIPLIRIDTTDKDTKEGEVTNPNGCIVKGMGLVVAVQNRRATFYIYPRFPQQPSDFFIEIKGPSEDFGSATISIGSNLSQMSTISKQFSPTPRPCNIVVNYKVNNTYVRVTYVPCSEGPHELSVLQNEKHVVGSPYHIIVDKSSEEPFSYSKWKKLSEEEEDSKKKITRRRLRVLMKVVDFVTEKMLLTEDDIEFGTANTQNNFKELEVDFDSIIAAPNLEEALKKLEHGLQKGKEIQNNVLGSKDYNNPQLKDDKNKYVNNDQIQQQNEVEEINEFLQQHNEVEEINEFLDMQEGEVDLVYYDGVENVYFDDQVNHADIDFPEEDEHYNNLNIDMGDSDYVSCEDIHRSPHKNSEMVHIIERIGIDINNRKHEESSRYSDEQGHSETTFFLGPAEREIWGTFEEKNVNICNKEDIEVDTTLLNIRHYPRVLTPGVPAMSAITEESENSKIYVDCPETVTTKEISLFIPKMMENEQDIDYHEYSREGNNIDMLAPNNCDELVSCSNLNQIDGKLKSNIKLLETIERIENVKAIHQAADIDVGSYHAKMVYADDQNCPEIKPEEFPKIIVSDSKRKINEGYLSSGSATSILNVKHKKSFRDELLSSPIKGKDSIQAQPKPKRLSNNNLKFAKDGESMKTNHRSRRHPSILIPGIVSKWKRCFENKNEAPSIGEKKCSRQSYPNDERAEATNRQNMVSQWKQFWDELLINQTEKQHTSPIAIKNKDEEKPIEALKPGIVASSRQVFEKQTGAFKTETITQIKSVTSKSPLNITIAYDPLVKNNIVSEVNSSVYIPKIESMDTLLINSKSYVNKANSSLAHNSNKMATSNQSCSFQNTGLNGHGIEDRSNLKEKEVCSEKLGSYRSETFNYLHFTEPMKNETDESTCDDPSVQKCIDQSVPEKMNPEDQELSLQTNIMSGSSVIDAVLPACPKAAVVLYSYSDKKDDITSKNTEKSRERYEQAKSFFQKLESQSHDSAGELTGSHPRVSRSVTSMGNLWEVSQSDLWDKSVTRRHKFRRKKKESRGIRSAPASDTETRLKMDRGSSSESELGGSGRCKKVLERFHVKDLFLDVAGEFCGGSIGHGVPHREAVLAALRSVDEDLDRSGAVSPYEYTNMTDEHYGTSIATCPVPLSYQPEFPYISNTPPNLYRSRMGQSLRTVRNGMLGQGALIWRHLTLSVASKRGLVAAGPTSASIFDHSSTGTVVPLQLE
ncbi:unnamed protein product [Timema podura]|uniref:DUF3715 domain-containing protein n=1 Tax=Timema podura TaxID=61482 RepID=A0ABN7NSF9_TIMPD|nr:unnamed protein product [Timema podura]